MKRVKKVIYKLKRFSLKCIIYFFSITLGFVLVFKFVPIPLTLTMLGQWVKGGELYYNWEPIEKISPEMPIAVVAAEDQLFLEHYGFDFNAIKKAIKSNQKTKKLRGGSTISQQTAKNVFLWQNRSWLRKGLETYFTFLIEIIWGKKRILEVYLNVCEMGPQTFGAEAASQRYFKIPAAKLNRNKAAKIAAVLPSPRKWKVVNSGAYVNKRTAHIERQIRQLGGPAYLKELNL